MKVYVIRHGETEWNRVKKLQGSADNPLNANGMREAEAASRYLKEIPFDAAYMSPLKRAKETCRIILRDRKCRPEILDTITELDYGICEGDDIGRILSEEDHPVHNFFLRPGQYAPAAGGETLDRLEQRCAAFVSENILPMEGRCRYLLVVTHGAFIKGLMRYLKGLGKEAFWSGRESGNCALTILDCTDGVIKAECEGRDIL